MKKSHLYIITVLLVLLGLAAAAYHRYAAPTRIAFVNYMDFIYDEIVEANDNSFIRTKQIPFGPDAFAHADNYDAIFFFAHGKANLTDEQKAQIAELTKKGIPFFSPFMGQDGSADRLKPEEVKYIGDCMDNGGTRNIRRMLNYTRKVFDRKALFVDPLTPPFLLPDSYYYHMGDEEVFADAESYIAFLKKAGHYHDGGKNIVILAQQFGANSDSSYVNQLVSGLEKQGCNVFPTVAWGPARMKYVKDANPDMILFVPHGRFGDDRMVEWMWKENIPLLCPLVVFGPEDEWRNDPQGMSGGMLSQALTMPEIDGGAVPFVIAAQMKNERGLYVFRGIEKRVQTFLKLTEKWLALQDKPNAEKKIAIFYYKGPGMNAMVAEGLELAPSILSLLERLQKEGYNTGSLPLTPEELMEDIQKQGPTFGTYAKGSIDNFLANGSPEFLSASAIEAMMQKRLAPKLIADVLEKYGPAPGEYMTTSIEGERTLALARVRYGNVVLIPVPPAGIGDDSVGMIHGTNAAPPYPYIAAYLWAQEGFGADALIHFGTHGSVEFTPKKQAALSNLDWPDALLAGTPHFYIYVISNVGEATIAKRRAYAVTNTHLTAPLMQSDIYGPLEKLDELISRFQDAGESLLREEYRLSLRTLILENDLDKDLNLTLADDEPLSDEAIQHLHHYLDSVAVEKVTKGLHVFGVADTVEEIDDTARMMSLDNLRYRRVQLDLARRAITKEQAENDDFTKQAYGEEVTALVNAIIAKGAEPESLIDDTTRAILKTTPDRNSPEFRLWSCARDYSDALYAIPGYRKALASSGEAELHAVVNSLNGGYTPPQSGGDPAFNPEAVPTGRNLYSINAEQTPTKEAYEVAKKLVNTLLERQKTDTGEYPRKVAFSLWGGEFVRQEGTTIGEIFYTLGIEPVRDRRGTVRDVKLIPLSELGRPRIDVVVQTSGQFRDLAASRITLINKAVELAANAKEEEIYPNYVREGMQLSEAAMKKEGLAPAEARKLSTIRVFGSVSGGYGTGITGLVESGDRWESPDEIAQQYVHNMGAMYGEGVWGLYKPGAFTGALQHTDMIVHPRSNNTWGPLSLDHVYEFMGGMSSAVQFVTGKDVNGWFSDLRNPHDPKVQSLKEAVWVEARSKVLNPKYIKGMQEEGATAANVLATTIRNTYGWDSMKSSAIDEALWDQIDEVYIEDKFDLGMESYFRAKNPYALQEITAVMMEVARKGFWKPDEATLRKISTLHASLVRDYGAGCSGFVCDNAKLRDFIGRNVDAPLKTALAEGIDKAREARAAEEVKGVELKKQENKKARPQAEEKTEEKRLSRYTWLILLLAVLLLSGVIIRKRKQA